MKRRPMRIMCYVLISAMLSQTVIIPAADPIPIDFDLVVKGSNFEFRSEMVVSDDGTGFYIRNNEVILDDGTATGIAVGREFFDKGALGSFVVPALAYVDGAARSVLIHGQVGGVDSLGVVDFSGLPAAALPGKSLEEVDPRLIILLYFTALAASLPAITGIPSFFPGYRAFFIDGFRENPAFSALMVFSLWGFFGVPGLAEAVFSGRVGGTLFDPLVYTFGGLIIAALFLSNPFLFEQIRLRGNYFMTAIAASAFTNGELIPASIAFIGMITKVLYDQSSGYRIERTLTAAILITYLFGFPGLTSPTRRYRLNSIFEVRGGYRRLGLVTGYVGLSGGDKQMSMWLALASKRLDLRASPQGAELDAEPQFDADFDDSGTVDADDFEHFVEYYTGPSPGTALDPAGQDADFDLDGDVDQLDFNIFIGQYQTPEWEPPAPAPKGSGLEADPLDFDQEMHNAGLAIPIITEGDPVPGHPDLTVSFFFFTQAGGMGTALIGLTATDSQMNFVPLLLVVNNEGTFCAMRAGQDLGDGEISTIDKVININVLGQFMVSVSLTSGEKAIYGFSPPGANDTAVGDAWMEY